MNVKRGSWSLLLIGALLATLLAGCAGGEKGGSGSGEAASKELKIMRTYHPSLEQFQGSDTINDNKLIKLLREWSGFNVQYETLPKDNSAQKISVIMASGSVPDILWVPGKADYFKLAQQGALEPLDDYVAQYMPNLKKIFTEEELDAVRYEGKLYAIPHRSAQKVGAGVLLRQDVFAELGLNAPASMNELYAAMKTIKEKKGIFPFTAAASNPGGFLASFAPFAGAFGVGTTTVEKDGKLEFAWLQPEYREFLATMKQWYDEGLIDQEFALNKDVKERMINASAAIGTVYWADAFSINNSMTEKSAGGELLYIPFPVGESGKSGIPEQGLTSLYQVIPKQAKNKEVAAQYFNFIFGEEADTLTTYGIKGEDYTVDNGEVAQTPEQSNAIPWRTLYVLSDTDPSFFARLKAKGFLPYYEPLTAFKQVREESAYAPSVKEWDAKFNELRNYLEENAIKFIMGKRDLAEFDKFAQEFNAKGGTEAIDALNEWYTNK